MFTCNSLTLLTFTYYLKVILSICMFIIPFILLEKISIKIIRYKKKNKKIDKFIIKKESKTLFYTIIIFILSFTIHNILNTDDNVCYNYAKKEVIHEYKLIYNNLKNENISDNVKKIYLANDLLTAYNN